MESLEKHILKYGIYTTIGLIALFFFMKVLGLIYILELRALNAAVMFTGVFLAIKKFKSSGANLEFNYLSGIGTGFAVGLVTATLFSLFVMTYLYLDGFFFEAVIAQQSQKLFMNEITVSMVIFIEALASGFLLSYASMQWLKQDKIVPLSEASQA